MIVDKVRAAVGPWAGGERERYAPLDAVSHYMSVRIRRISVASLAVAALLLGDGGLFAQSGFVNVYVTHIEANEMRFESMEQLREYLLIAPNDFFGIFIGECEAKSRESEVMRVVVEVLGKRLAARGQGSVGVDIGVDSVLCPEPRH